MKEKGDRERKRDGQGSEKKPREGEREREILKEIDEMG